MTTRQSLAQATALLSDRLLQYAKDYHLGKTTNEQYGRFCERARMEHLEAIDAIANGLQAEPSSLNNSAWHQGS